MSGDGQQQESFDGVSATGGGTGTGGPPSEQVPSQADRRRQSTGEEGGGTVLPGQWPPAPAGSPAPADANDDAAAAAVPMQRMGGSSSATDASGLAPSDAQLIQWMRDGDDLAYEELFRRHSDAVRRYARTCCRDTHTADDLTAEVFARTLQAVRGGKGPKRRCAPT